MPTQIKMKDGLRWQARVYADGKQIGSQLFPHGKKGGPEWRAAKQWEEEQKQQYLAGVTILSDFERLLQWGNLFLEHTARTTSTKDLKEKTRIMQAFFAYCHEAGIKRLEEVNPAKAYAFLSGLYDTNGGHVANKFRQRLMTAWHWGVDFVEGFPQVIAPFKKVKPFPVEKTPRYVPPEEDMIKVMQQAKGQDLVMLMVFYYTGARANEVFKLHWSDVDFPGNKIRLTDRKTGGKGERVRWLPMHSELAKALEWWKQTRPALVEHVFFQVQCLEKMGEPFTYRSHYMPAVCKRLGIKKFTFHSIRHKSAVITFLADRAKGLNNAQILMRHSNPMTTLTYVKSSVDYVEKEDVTAALANSAIGQAVDTLFDEMKMPHEVRTHEAICKATLVIQ